MIIQAGTKGLRETTLREYVARFAFGGLMTVVAGLIAKEFGPAIGGLFLAFPAIFPASATLVEKHQRKRKQEAGLTGTRRGTDAAAADAAGASIGGLALVFFASTLTKLLPDHSATLAMSGALCVWTALSVGAWWVWKRHR